jgi:hypothetical protein
MLNRVPLGVRSCECTAKDGSGRKGGCVKGSEQVVRRERELFRGVRSDQRLTHERTSRSHAASAVFVSAAAKLV